MSFQDLSNSKPYLKKVNSIDSKQQQKSSLLINSSFTIEEESKGKNKQITSEVLKKVSQTIVSLHSTLVPKTQNIEIYRDLSQQEQKMLKMVQDNKLIHTILAGVLAIDSCLKYIHREQTYIISSLMKGVTIALGNYKKLQEEFLCVNQGKISQNFLKFYDSLKLIISQIHKIPAAKIKKNEIQKHNEIIVQSKLNNQLTNTLNRQQNLLFAFLAQQNNSLRIKNKELQKQICQLQKQKQKITKSNSSIETKHLKKRGSQNNFTQTGSQSFKGFQSQSQIRELREQLLQKNDMIVKMNDQFGLEIQKYEKVFKRLQQQNKLLKKYNDLDTAYILEQLQFQVQRLKYQKRNDQNIINQIMQKMDRMSWNKMELDYKNIQKFKKQERHAVDRKYTPFNTNIPNTSRLNERQYEMRRSRCPSVSPQNNEMSNLSNRYFSPNYPLNYEVKEVNKRSVYPNIIQNTHYDYPKKRSNSPTFGNPSQDRNYSDLKQRISLSKQRKSKIAVEYLKNKFTDQGNQIKEMRKSQTKFSHMKPSGVIEHNNEATKVRNRMRKSTFLNQQINY